MSKRGPEGRDYDRSNKSMRQEGHIVKMLCPFFCAGAIIGKGGETIKALKDKTGAVVKVSKNDERFPTTSERVISIQGEAAAIEECVLFCQEKIRKDEPPEHAKRDTGDNSKRIRKESCKLVVADTSAGRIIGKGGQRIKDMKNDYNVTVNITRKDEMPPGLNERCVSIEGEDSNVDNCIKEVVKTICEDDTAVMEWNIYYNDFNDDRRDDRGRDGGGRDGGYDRGFNDRDRDWGFNDRDRGFNDRDARSGSGFSGGSSYGGGRDMGYSGGRDRDFGRREDRDGGFRRDEPRDAGYGRRDDYGSRGGGGRDDYRGGNNFSNRRDDYRGGSRDAPRGGGMGRY